MTQLSLLDPFESVANRHCIYEPPCADAKSILGPSVIQSSGCVNRDVTCSKCHRHVLVLSTRKDASHIARKGARRQVV